MTDQVKDEEVKQENKEPQENKQQPEEAKPQETQEQDDPVEKNWKAVREKQKEEERKRKEHERKIAEQQEMIKALEQVINKGGNNEEPKKDSNGVELHPQEWVTGEQLEKIRKEDRKHFDEMKKKEEQYRQQMEMQQKLNNNYPDYKDVLNQDNLAYLEYHEPEIAASIQQIQDPYLQVAAAYKNVKAFVPQMHERDKQKMERTQNAPGSLSDPSLNNHTNQNPSGGTRPGRLSKQRKEELWREMVENSR